MTTEGLAVEFQKTKLDGVFLLEIERRDDERGFFARVFCDQEFSKHGIEFTVRQCNRSFNKSRGTLRGMHYQAEPYAEGKVVWCVRGAMHDVVVDLRKDSPTYLHHITAELTEENGRMIYIPAGFAHGFLTLRDNTEVFYWMSAAYHPEAARGLRYDDPSLAITWPFPPTHISDRDSNFPSLPSPKRANRYGEVENG